MTLPERIVSLLPSSTEIVCALGLRSRLVGVSHECDYPADVRSKPILVRSVFDGAHPSSGEISRIISQRVRQGLGLYITDQAPLRAAEPDLLLTQTICDV